MNRMLSKIPTVRTNLREWGAEFHIIGEKEQTSDLPEYRSEKGKFYIDTRGVRTTIDERTRGKGGIYTSCGEENLLHLPGDRYGGGYDICLHEFAHAIMDFGLDEQLARRIQTQYQLTIKKGLWSNAYAAVNEGEFWAELSMWYFGAHGEFLTGTRRPAAGPDSLRAYDPESFALLDSIYSGLLQTKLMKVLPAMKVSSQIRMKRGIQNAYLLVVNNSSKAYQLRLVDLKQKETVKEIPAYSRIIEPTHLNEVWQVFYSGKKMSSFWRVHSTYVKIILPAISK